MAPEAGIVATPGFEVVPDSLKLPPDLSFGEVPDLSQDWLFVFSRRPHQVSVFAPD
jgi:hypothetical protein